MRVWVASETLLNRPTVVTWENPLGEHINRYTHMTEHITFLQLHWRAVMKTNYDGFKNVTDLSRLDSSLN